MLTSLNYKQNLAKFIIATIKLVTESLYKTRIFETSQISQAATVVDSATFAELISFPGATVLGSAATTFPDLMTFPVFLMAFSTSS